MKRLLASVALLSLAASLFAPASLPAFACSCVAVPAHVHINNADVILIGKVVKIIGDIELFPEVLGKSTGKLSDLDAVIVVERYLKGSGAVELIADDPPSGGACGFFDRDSVGERYLLFLTGDTSPFQTGLCTGSTRLVDEPANQRYVEEVQTITGPGLPPERAAPLAADGDDPWPAVGLWSVLGATALLAASAWALRRRIIGRD